MARFGRLGWFLGLIFGTVFGVLFAPRKGSELRARIKADRKKGKLGIAPLHNDFKDIGEELAGVAKDIYQSDVVQDMIDKIKPLQEQFQEQVQDRVHFVRSEITRGGKKAKKVGKIGKRAIREIKSEMKKKS